MSVLTVTLQRLRPFIVKAFIAAFLLGAVVVSQAQSSQIENTLMPQPTQTARHQWVASHLRSAHDLSICIR